MDANAAGVEPVDQPSSPPKRAPKPSPPGSVWRELPILIVVAVALAILLKTFLLQAFFIPSGSMENTLRVGDRVMVNKVVYHLRDIKRGDIVVFDGLDSFTPEVTITEPTNPVAKGLSWFAGLVGFAPPSEKDFIKRVIGVPGDRVACCDGKGRVTVNGVVARVLGVRADPRRDVIAVDGEPLRLAGPRRTILLHKPRGVVATMADPEGRPTVRDLVRDVPERIYPVGRLDLQTTGALLLTNDGRLAAALLAAI